MVTDWDIYGELVFEAQRYLWKRGVDLQYDWMAPWPFLLAGLDLRRALRMLRTVCAWIRDHDW